VSDDDQQYLAKLRETMADPSQARRPDVTDHAFRVSAWPDTCGHAEDDGWFCGHSRTEHADQGEADETVN
jgi:hypothetical protein